MASNARQKGTRQRDEDSDCGEGVIVHKSNEGPSDGGYKCQINKTEVNASATSEKQLLKKQNFRVVRFMFEASFSSNMHTTVFQNVILLPLANVQWRNYGTSQAPKGIKLRMDSVPLATACALYHRFFRDFSPQDFDQHTIATTCLYLAGKIEEEHVGLTDVINVCHRILFTEEAPLDIGSTYWTLRDSVTQCEMFLTRALKFNLSFNHPHKYLMHYLKSLYDWLDASVVERTPIARTAWALLRDSYHGDICLSYPPNLIAVSVLYLALQCYGVSVPYDADARLHWWQALVDDVTLVKIKKVVCELIEIYDLETTTTTTTANV